jgi:hypothetical protein
MEKITAVTRTGQVVGVSVQDGFVIVRSLYKVERFAIKGAL